MKKNIILSSKTLAILLFVLIAKTINAQNQNVNSKIILDTTTFTVSAMECSTDSKMVEKALYRKKGVKKVTIKDDIITIIYNSTKVTQTELIQVIENTGTCEDPNAKVHKVTIKT